MRIILSLILLQSFEFPLQIRDFIFYFLYMLVLTLHEFVQLAHRLPVVLHQSFVVLLQLLEVFRILLHLLRKEPQLLVTAKVLSRYIYCTSYYLFGILLTSLLSNLLRLEFFLNLLLQLFLYLLFRQLLRLHLIQYLFWNWLFCFNNKYFRRI